MNRLTKKLNRIAFEKFGSSYRFPEDEREVLKLIRTYQSGQTSELHQSVPDAFKRQMDILILRFGMFKHYCFKSPEIDGYFYHQSIKVTTAFIDYTIGKFLTYVVGQHLDVIEIQSSNQILPDPDFASRYRIKTMLSYLKAIAESPTLRSSM